MNHINLNISVEQILPHLIELQQKPASFTPGEPLFWDDPHISSQMLAFHLDPLTEAASRNAETIDRIVKWLIDFLRLESGDSLLDLGCGPGLYTARFARAGFKVNGVDYSRRSIEYASRCAKENNLQIDFRYENYLELPDTNQYDAAFLIYGDFCPLDPEQRARLLQNVRRALKPDGRFVLDVTTRECRKKHGKRQNTEILMFVCILLLIIFIPIALLPLVLFGCFSSEELSEMAIADD